MLGSTTTGAVRAFVTASSARGRDSGLYRRYAAGLCRQALLTRAEPALPERVVCDVIVNEHALARISERGEDDPRHIAALLHAVIRRLVSSRSDEGRHMSRAADADPPESRRK
jgi:hypothetical protein